MQFIKKHYEKVLLGLVLLGLTVAVALLPVIISSKRAKLKAFTENRLHPKIKELPALDTALEDAALKRVQTPVRFDFTHAHNLFNPVVWLKTADGKPVKVAPGSALGGPEVLEITGMAPLYLRLAFNSVSGNSYLIGVENQAAAQLAKRKREYLASQGAKNDLFSLLEVKGTPEKPTELTLILNETGEQISIGPGKPFERVDGYTVDLKYPPENKSWRAKRVNETLAFANAQYKIVAITQTNVVILAPNDKKTTINFTNSISTLP